MSRNEFIKYIQTIGFTQHSIISCIYHRDGGKEGIAVYYNSAAYRNSLTSFFTGYGFEELKRLLKPKRSKSFKLV